MMETQFYVGHAAVLQTIWGEPLRVDHLGGEFAVRSGRVWLTRRGDLDDHVLEAGDRLVLEPAESVVIEQWHRDVPAIVDWTPRVQPGPLAALARRVAVWGLRRAEARFAALARSA